MLSAESVSPRAQKKEPRPPRSSMRAQAKRQYLMEQTTNTGGQQDRQEATG